MTTDRVAVERKLLHRTMVALIYPAILGAVVYSLVQAILTGTLFASGWFPVVSSILMVVYFGLDYWTTTRQFEEVKDYGWGYFLTDVLLLGALSSAFYHLWEGRSDMGFFLSVIAMLVLLLCWSSIIEGRFKPFDRYAQTVYVCVAASLLGFLLPLAWSGSAAVLLSSRLVALATYSVAIVIYRSYILAD